MAKRSKYNTPAKIADWADKKADESKALANLDITHIVKEIDAPGLSPEQRRVLAVSMLPETDSMTITEKAGIAGVNRRTWWRAWKDEKFLEVAARLGRLHWGTELLPLTRQYIKKAKYGGQDGLGSETAMARILTQQGVLDKVETGGASSVAIQINVDARRQDNLTQGLDKFGVQLAEVEVKQDEDDV